MAAISATLGILFSTLGGMATGMGATGLGGVLAGIGTFSPGAFALGFQSELEERMHRKTVELEGERVAHIPVHEHRWPSNTLTAAAYLNKLQPAAPFGTTFAMGDIAEARRAIIQQPPGTPIPHPIGKPFAAGRCLGSRFPEGMTFDFAPETVRAGDAVALVSHAQAVPMVKRFCGIREDGAWLFYQRVPEMILAVPADMVLHVEKVTTIDLPGKPGTEMPPDAMSEAIGLTMPSSEVAAENLPSLGDWHFALQVAIDEMRERYAARLNRREAA